MTYFLICLALLLVGLLVRAFLLPLVHRLLLGWTWLYTWGLSPEVRQRRRAELRSDLWEQVGAERELGYRPESIALHQLLRCTLGIPADLSWRRAYTRWLPGEAFPDAEVGEELSRCLRRLSARERRVISLKFDADLTNVQIAQVMGLSQTGVRVLLVRALQQLRNSLAHGA